MARTASLCLLLAALPLAAQTQVPPPTPDVPIWADRSRQVAAANCAVDIGIATVFLGKAGLSINSAVQTCPNQTTSSQKAVCSASVSGILASFGFVATFIEAAAAECAATLQYTNKLAQTERACAADISILISNLLLAANAGSNLPISCNVNKTKTNESLVEQGEEDDAIDSGRRLQPGRPGRRLQLDAAVQERMMELGSDKAKVMQELEKAMSEMEKRQPMLAHARSTVVVNRGKRAELEKARKEEQADQAACAFEIGQATVLLARAGMMMNAAIEDCSARSLFEGGDLKKAKCTAEITRMIAAFGFTASGIAFAVFHCPKMMKNLDAACAGSIINLVAVLNELAAAGASYTNTCNQLKVVPGGFAVRDPPVTPQNLSFV